MEGGFLKVGGEPKDSRAAIEPGDSAWYFCNW